MGLIKDTLEALKEQTWCGKFHRLIIVLASIFAIYTASTNSHIWTSQLWWYGLLVTAIIFLVVWWVGALIFETCVWIWTGR